MYLQLSPYDSIDAARSVSPSHPCSKYYLLIGMLVVTFLFNLTSDLVQSGLVLVLKAVTKGTVGRERGRERERERERERKRKRERENVRWAC